MGWGSQAALAIPLPRLPILDLPFLMIHRILAALMLPIVMPSAVAGAQPNILFILADDHTTQAISCYGGYLADFAQTENIDRLAREGVRLANCFCNNSICTPSRASILTGQYSHQNGVYLLGQALPGDSVTFPMHLRRTGYQTGLFGKWHLKSGPMGFDEYYVLQQQGRYQDPQFVTIGSEQLVTKRGWSTDVITDLTIDFLRRRDRKKPFLAMCQFKATHDPWASREPYRSLWKNERLPQPENLFDDYNNRGNASRRTTLKLEQINQSTYPHDRLADATRMRQREHIYQQYIKDFLRCGRVLDANVGRLMRFLKDEKLDQNTVVIYTADQGHFLGEHGFFSKRFMYDESMRMPFIIRYPKVLPAGAINDDMISNVDFAPTVLELAGVEASSAMQGRSFMKNLQGETPDDWPKAVYYHYWQHLLHRNVTAHYGIRTKDAKLIYFYGHPLGMTKYEPTEPEWEFFDLGRDPSEMVNEYANERYAGQIASLKNELRRIKEKIGDVDDKRIPAWN